MKLPIMDPKESHSLDAAAMRERIAARNAGLQFSVLGEWWHWKDPNTNSLFSRNMRTGFERRSYDDEKYYEQFYNRPTEGEDKCPT